MEDNKKSNLKLIIVVILCIAICLPLCIWIEVKFINPSENKPNDEINEELQKKEDDVYGYALMSYLVGDGSSREYYRIVELHKNDKDKVLVSYDTNGYHSIDKPNRIGRIKIIKNKLYYQLYYNSDDFGILTYNNIMYIDLNSDKKEPVELLNWKQDSYNYTNTLGNFKITDDYVYFNTRDFSKYYKYNIKTKETTTINESDYELIKEQLEINNEMTYQDKIYLNGKELVLDHQKLELVYDGEVIYKSKADVGIIELLYSFENDIVINEGSDCFGYGCNTSKYYKYNADKKAMEEIDSTKNQLYSKDILYK